MDKIEQFLVGRLEMHGDHKPFLDTDSLFVSGRLDSLDALQTVLFLETEFLVDFSQLEFSIEVVDSVAAIKGLIAGHNPQR